MIDKTKKTRFPLTITKVTKDKLEFEADKQGLSINSIIILAINDYIKKIEKEERE